MPFEPGELQRREETAEVEHDFRLAMSKYREPLVYKLISGVPMVILGLFSAVVYPDSFDTPHDAWQYRLFGLNGYSEGMKILFLLFALWGLLWTISAIRGLTVGARRHVEKLRNKRSTASPPSVTAAPPGWPDTGRR